MGGRGASSGASGGASGGARSVNKALGTAEAKVKSLQSKETKLGGKMAEYAKYATPAYTGKDKQAKAC